ncbi:hypothetical protein NDU88_006334 [Pleurodeles waltl]|uniref:Uncharacterized protein n=1 Tax=Pleurodeles waltl TaxID=8319 RepID=A0AAV7UKP7_PLEWA|nr:hypothetical protein NDU88_006334 [Pleurodeles waltl]
MPDRPCLDGGSREGAAEATPARFTGMAHWEVPDRCTGGTSARSSARRENCFQCRPEEEAKQGQEEEVKEDSEPEREERTRWRKDTGPEREEAWGAKGESVRTRQQGHVPGGAWLNNIRSLWN